MVPIQDFGIATGEKKSKILIRKKSFRNTSFFVEKKEKKKKTRMVHFFVWRKLMMDLKKIYLICDEKKGTNK